MYLVGQTKACRLFSAYSSVSVSCSSPSPSSSRSKIAADTTSAARRADQHLAGASRGELRSSSVVASISRMFAVGRKQTHWTHNGYSCLLVVSKTYCTTVSSLGKRQQQSSKQTTLACKQTNKLALELGQQTQGSFIRRCCWCCFWYFCCDGQYCWWFAVLQLAIFACVYFQRWLSFRNSFL